MDLAETFGTETPLVGMVHLPALPGAPTFDGDRAAIREAARADARALLDAGFDALLVENYGDAPYYPENVPKHVVAEMTAVVESLDVDAPVGVNVLRNDAAAALSVAAATGGAFVRVNVHAGVRETDQGWIEGRAHETIRLRERIDADVAVFADVAVKHSAGPTDRDLGTLAAETLDRGLADGLIVSGPATGESTAPEELRRVLDARDDIRPDAPVFVGSGVTADNAANLLSLADGAIVGTAVKAGGETTNRVDQERAERVVEAAPR
jgi:membrane complex biogenesis BtpA family protein